MKKIRLVLIVAVVALLVVGGAYAAWTSRVTILTNASAGEMDVEISSITVGKVSEYVVFGADSISVSEDRKFATVTTKNLYPGAEANATIVITNIGTIPVMLSGASQVSELAVNTETNENLPTSAASMLAAQYTATAETKDGQVRASASSSEPTASLFPNTSIVIEAGKTIQFDMLITLDRNALDETENALFKFQFIPMFVQPTNGESTSGAPASAEPDSEEPAPTEPGPEEPAEQDDPASEVVSSSSLEGLTMQNNGMLGAWNGSEEYSGSAKDIIIPNTIDDKDIKRIGQNTFREKDLVAVSFQEGSQIEQIHARAFQNNNLTAIVLPDSLKRIDIKAFYGNPITNVTIPDGVTTIENNAFDKLTQITVGGNLTGLKDGAINGNNAFRDAYASKNGGSGTYQWDGKNWIKQ